MLFIRHAFTFWILLTSNDTLFSQNGAAVVMYITMRLRSAGTSVRVTNPSVRSSWRQKTVRDHINLDISCLGVFELLAIIQKKKKGGWWSGVCVCVCVCVRALVQGVLAGTHAFYSADGQKAVIVHFNWAFTAAFWASTWLEQVPSDYTLWQYYNRCPDQ